MNYCTGSSKAASALEKMILLTVDFFVNSYTKVILQLRAPFDVQISYSGYFLHLCPR
jgi:hypothetical protein